VSFFSLFLDTVSLPKSGPAFNVGPGVTVNGMNVVDNRCIDPFDVPEPSSPGLAAAGSLGLALRRRSRRRAETRG
jgi:hypothetical protein